MEYKKTIKKNQKTNVFNLLLDFDIANQVNWKDKNSYWLLNKNNKLTTDLKKKILSTGSFLSHIFIASSGTLSNGEIKIIALSKKALLLSAKETNKHLKITKNDKLFSPLPYYHVADLAVKARAYVSGASLVTKNYLKKWSPIDFLNILKKQNISVTSLVPAQVFDLVANNLTSPKNLRLVLVGGSHLSAELCYKAFILGWPIVPTYGMTELCSQVATASLKDLYKFKKLFLKKDLKKDLTKDSKKDFKKNLKKDLTKDYKTNSKKEDIKKEVYNYVTFFKILPHIKAKVQKEELYLQSKSLLSAEFVIKKENIVSKKFYKKEEFFLTGDNVLLKNKIINFKSKESKKIKIKSKLVFIDKLNDLLEDLNLNNNLNLTNIYLFLEEHTRDGFRLVLISDFASASLNKVPTLVKLFNSRVKNHEKIRLIYYFSNIPKTALGKLIAKDVKKLLKLNKK